MLKNITFWNIGKGLISCELRVTIVCLLYLFLGQILYLPLDRDLLDHSGKGTNGLAALGYTEPSFTCLIKSVNCSAVFTGQQCVSVPQIASTQFGDISSQDGAFTPEATFAVWFRRLQDDSQGREGIFGNSADKDMSPSWQIVAENAEQYVSAGIQTDTSPTGLEDYPFIDAPVSKTKNYFICRFK